MTNLLNFVGNMDKNTINFIIENESCDTVKLLLSASNYPYIDVPLAVKCIEARKRIKRKVPEWYNFPELEYPNPLSIEQCSSEITAKHKCTFIEKGWKIADLTGGLGVDSYFFAKKAHSVDYYEQNIALCKSVTMNNITLSVYNINVINADINSDYIRTIENKYYDLIFIDPDRRGGKGEKIYSISDCSPNIIELQNEIFRITDKILVKISPMADIDSTINLLPRATIIDIISVAGECKELLLLLEKSDKPQSAKLPVIIRGLNYNKRGDLISNFTFTQDEEQNARSSYFSPDKLYSTLYEPNSSILKSGAFKLTGERYGLDKVSINTHLYISIEENGEDENFGNFPGKIFNILEIIPFSKQTIKKLAKTYPFGSVSAKNFPLSSDDLKKRLMIREGDKYHLFATTLNGGEKIIFVTEKKV